MARFRRQFRDRKQGRPVFDALNNLGATAWVVNQPILERLIEAFEFGRLPGRSNILSKLSIPIDPSLVPIPDYKATFGGLTAAEIDTAEWKAFSKYSLISSKFLRSVLSKYWESKKVCGIFPR